MHLGCSGFTRPKRERGKQGSLIWNCCLRPPTEDENGDEEEEDEIPKQTVPVSNRPTQPTSRRSTSENPKISCSKCKYTIRKNIPRAVCITCGTPRHLACPRSQREEVRDSRREWSAAQAQETFPKPNQPHSHRRAQMLTTIRQQMSKTQPKSSSLMLLAAQLVREEYEKE